MMANSELPTLDSVTNDRDTRRALLKRLNLFTDVDGDICNAVADTSRCVHYRPGTLVVRQGEPPGVAYVILRGLLEINHAHENNLQSASYYLPYRGPGYPGGHNNLVCNDYHGYTVRTVIDSDLLVFDEAAFQDAFTRSPQLARNMLRYLRTLFRDTSDKLHSVMSLTTKEARIVAELVEIAQALDTQIIAGASVHPIVIDWLKRERFAEKIGCSPTVVAGTLRALKAAELIDVNDRNGRITLLQSDRLKRLYKELRVSTFKETLTYMIDRKWRA